MHIKVEEKPDQVGVNARVSKNTRSWNAKLSQSRLLAKVREEKWYSRVRVDERDVWRF